MVAAFEVNGYTPRDELVARMHAEVASKPCVSR